MKNVSANPMFGARDDGSVFSNHVVRRIDGEKHFRDHVIRNRSNEQVHSDQVGKRSFCS
jgi:hypothetical protein